jgi:hypothetical protein
LVRTYCQNHKPQTNQKLLKKLLSDLPIHRNILNYLAKSLVNVEINDHHLNHLSLWEEVKVTLESTCLIKKFIILESFFPINGDGVNQIRHSDLQSWKNILGFNYYPNDLINATRNAFDGEGDENVIPKEDQEKYRKQVLTFMTKKIGFSSHNIRSWLMDQTRRSLSKLPPVNSSHITILPLVGENVKDQLVDEEFHSSIPFETNQVRVGENVKDQLVDEEFHSSIPFETNQVRGIINTYKPYTCFINVFLVLFSQIPSFCINIEKLAVRIRKDATGGEASPNICQIITNTLRSMFTEAPTKETGNRKKRKLSKPEPEPEPEPEEKSINEEIVEFYRSKKYLHEEQEYYTTYSFFERLMKDIEQHDPHELISGLFKLSWESVSCCFCQPMTSSLETGLTSYFLGRGEKEICQLSTDITGSCDVCCQEQIRRVTVTSFPPYLMIEGDSKKTGQIISPILTTKDVQISYHIFAIIIFKNDHFTIRIKHADDCWYEHNDNIITKISNLRNAALKIPKGANGANGAKIDHLVYKKELWINTST